MAVTTCPRCGNQYEPTSVSGGLCPACVLGGALLQEDLASDDAGFAFSAGTQLGTFRILGILGRGGMGAVYRAFDEHLGRTIALKVLPAEFAYNEPLAKRFEREARVIAGLEHPHIVPLYATGVDEGTPWMSMRLMTGGSLRDVLEARSVTHVETVRLLRNVSDALDFAHARGVLHRDIKPSNILLDDAQRAFVGDFGLARMLETSDPTTRTSAVLGTPQYMAPERALGETVDHRSDIYSLGIVAYEMLIGRVPFQGESPIAVLLKQVNEPLPLPTDGSVPRPLVEAIGKATAKDPTDRWVSAGAFVSALEAGVGVAPLPVTTATTSRWRPIGQARRFLVGTSVAAVVGGIGLVWWLGGASGVPNTEPSPAPSASSVEEAERAIGGERPPATETASEAESETTTDVRAAVVAPPPPERTEREGSVPLRGAQPSVLRSPEAARKTIEGDLDLPPLPTRPAGSATTGTVTPPRVSPRASAGGAGSTANAESPARPVTVAGPPGTTGGREGVSQEDVPTVVPPRRTRAVSPEYPAAARAAQVEGDVVLSAVVNPDGTVGPVSVLRSVHPLLDEAAKAAVLQYRYAPALQGSTPVAATVRVVISFQLN